MIAAMIDSPTHTVASSMTATLRANLLKVRCRTPRSAKILTMTGTALTDRARAANTANDQTPASDPRSLGSARWATARVEVKGRPSAPRLTNQMVRTRPRTNGKSMVAPATPMSSTPQKRAMPRSGAI